ncbi:hypothetical protein Golob_011575 [Gossypium lobatum]|uniref:Uncharacterized protein n=1 Tax=Gossypium lobatum TaxID=34289 RepID=A0A7J8MPX3_9ROSI|nr:hypothetical protein [Gossypium lobatum]
MYCSVELLDGYEASIGLLYGGISRPRSTTNVGSSMGDGNVGLGEENIELPIDYCEQPKHQQRHRDNHQGLTGSSYWFKNNCKLPHNYGIHNGGLCMSPSSEYWARPRAIEGVVGM